MACALSQVLYLTEPIDEPAVNAIGEFEDFKFVDVTREGLELGDVAEEDKKKARACFWHACSLSAARLHRARALRRGCSGCSVPGLQPSRWPGSTAPHRDALWARLALSHV